MTSPYTFSMHDSSCTHRKYTLSVGSLLLQYIKCNSLIVSWVKLITAAGCEVLVDLSENSALLPRSFYALPSVLHVLNTCAKRCDTEFLGYLGNCPYSLWERQHKENGSTLYSHWGVEAYWGENMTDVNTTWTQRYFVPCMLLRFNKKNGIPTRLSFCLAFLMLSKIPSSCGVATRSPETRFWRCSENGADRSRRPRWTCEPNVIALHTPGN